MPAIPAAASRRRENARDRRSGRFGEQEHTAPEVAVALTSMSFEDLDHAESERLRRTHERHAFDEVLAQSRVTARYFAFRNRRTDCADDIVSDTVLEVLQEFARGRHIPNAGALTATVAKRQAYRYIDRDAHHTALTARRKLAAWEYAFMQEHGRSPSTRESEAEAERIRMARPPGQRPSPGFQQTQEPVSLHADDDALYAQLTETPARPDVAPVDSEAALVVDAIEAKGSYSRADARRNIWNILAGNDAPAVATRSVDDDRAHRAAVTRAGGAAAVAAAWARGETAEADPATEGLFAPFGNVPEKAREQVVTLLLGHPQYADHIWDSAMTAAVDVQRLRAIKRREQRAAATPAMPAAA